MERETLDFRDPEWIRAGIRRNRKALVWAVLTWNWQGVRFRRLMVRALRRVERFGLDHEGRL